MSKICYIVGAGEFFGIKRLPEDGDFVIAADGGFDYLREIGIRPNLIIGDFDSSESLKSDSCWKQYENQENMIILPSEKDDTDMWAALQEGMKRGFNEFLIYGGTGGRLDHTLANIQLLAWLSQHGKRGTLIGKQEIITSITDTEMAFEVGTGRVSMFAHTEKATGVYITGMKYPLTDATVTNTYPIGISNERMGKESKISVKQGTLILLIEVKGTTSDGVR